LLQNPEPDWRDTIDQVKRAVPMREALRIVGWRVRSRSRCDCGLCKGSSKGKVAFNDRLWHCHRCDQGGSVIDLIMCAHGSDFSTALKFLAVAGRIQLPTATSARELRWLQREQKKRRQEREELDADCDDNEQEERELRSECCDFIHFCDDIMALPGEWS
jgi:DNA primase